MDSIAMTQRIVEGSPAIVLILLLGMIVMAAVVRALFNRLNVKDDQVLAMHEKTLTAMNEVAGAVRELKNAILRSEHRP